MVDGLFDEIVDFRGKRHGGGGGGGGGVGDDEN